MEGITTMITSVSGALGDFTPANLGTIVVAGLAISVPLVIAWFAIRFVTRKAKKALTKGGI